MEGRGRRADTGRTTKGYGGGRRAEREKFLLRFSKAPISESCDCKAEKLTDLFVKIRNLVFQVFNLSYNSSQSFLILFLSFAEWDPRIVHQGLGGATLNLGIHLEPIQLNFQFSIVKCIN